MTTVDKLANWVKTKPIILIRFDDDLNNALVEARRGLEYFTFAKPHYFFRGLSLPTLCLIETQEYEGTRLYLATATRKSVVTTCDTRLTLKKFRQLVPASLKELRNRISEKPFQGLFDKKISDAEGIYALSSKLSAHIVQILAKEPDNQNALDVVFSLLSHLRYAPNNNWSHEDAIQTAMAVFGIRANEIPMSISLKSGTSSGLGLIGPYLYEDNVIRADASAFPGFDTVSPDVTGMAVFQKRDERLVIYTANKLPLEEMLGVDLIYINDTRGNIVMIQYKMLEEKNSQSDKKDWIYRPDGQLSEELARMRIPACQGEISDYRLNRNPFFLNL